MIEFLISLAADLRTWCAAVIGSAGLLFWVTE
jgi:hypothetical protein